MLQQLFHIVLISCICCLWGIPILLTVKKNTGLPHPWYKSTTGFFAFLFFLGCLTLGMLASWLYLFLPLKFHYLLSLTVLLIFILVAFCRKETIALLSLPVGQFRFSSGTPTTGIIGRGLFGLTCLILLLMLSSLKTVNPDTNVYHWQIIRWTAQYRAVPGVANAFLRLGLGSNWFCLISIFYLPWFKNENFTYLNATLAIWFFLWLFSNWKYHFDRLAATPGNRLLCFFYFLILSYSILDWELLRDAVNSANYDMVVTAFTLIAVCFLLERIFEPEHRTGFSLLFVVIILSTITFKLSGIFSLLLVGYHVINNRPSKKQLSLGLFAALLLLTPVLIKNYITTGYLLYPFPFSPGSPDWKVPKGLIQGLNHYITCSNRYQSYDTPSLNSFPNDLVWIPDWFFEIPWPQKVLVALTLSSIALFFARTDRTDLKIDHRQLRQLLAMLLLMILGWLFTAPAPRFGFGALLCAGFLSLSVALYKKLKAGWYNLFFFLITVVCVVYLCRKAAPLVQTPAYLLHPPDAGKAPYRVVVINGIPFHLMEKTNGDTNNRSYNTDFPDIYQENPYLQPRGSSLQNGFRITPYPDSAFIRNYQY